MKIDSVEAKLNQMVQEIAKDFQPQKIILFGSWAWGKPHEGSDVDLLIVVPHPPPMRERWKITSEFRPHSARPLQLVFMSPEEFEETKDVVGGVAYPASHGGKSLYEAHS